MKKQASRSILSSSHQPYECKHPWPEKTKVQCGDRGLVLSRNGQNYRTAFFEAFPRRPATFIRGEGASIEEAEEAAWSHYKRIKECPQHEFERRGRDDHYGFCRHCNLFKKALPSLRHCSRCRSTQVYSTIGNDHFCRRHHLLLSFEEFCNHSPSMVRSLSCSFLRDKVLLKALSTTTFPWKKKMELLDDYVLTDRINRHIFAWERENDLEEEGYTESAFAIAHETAILEIARAYWRERGENIP